MVGFLLLVALLSVSNTEWFGRGDITMSLYLLLGIRALLPLPSVCFAGTAFKSCDNSVSLREESDWISSVLKTDSVVVVSTSSIIF